MAKRYTRKKVAAIAVILVAMVFIAGFVFVERTSNDNETPPAATSTPVIASTSPTTPSSTTLLWGAYIGDLDGSNATPLVSAFTSAVGKSPDIIAVFTDLASGDFPSDLKTSVGAPGKILFVFLEPTASFDQIMSGYYDSVLKEYAAASASYGYPIILAPFDEFNLNENAWGYGVNGNTPAKFIAAWRHVHNFFAADPNVKFALVYNQGSVPDTSENSFTAYYPGNAYVDYLGVDGFNFGTTDADAESFPQLFDGIMPTLESFGKPILFSSIGSLEFPGKAAWIAEGLGQYIKQFPGVAGWIYFDYNDVAAGQDWKIDTDPASLAEFKAAVP